MIAFHKTLISRVTKMCVFLRLAHEQAFHLRDIAESHERKAQKEMRKRWVDIKEMESLLVMQDRIGFWRLNHGVSIDKPSRN